MSQVQAEIQVVDTDRRIGRSLWADAARRIRRDMPAMICLSIIILYAVVALFVGFLLPDWSDNVDYDNIHKPPSAKHWLGTDEFGRDVLEKTFLGAQVSMTVGFMANIIAIPLG